MFKKIIIILTFSMLLILPSTALAHQKINLTSGSTSITDPETARAIYGELHGQPARVDFKSDKDFEIYLSILVANSTDEKFSGEVYGPNDRLIGVIDGEGYTWTEYKSDFDGKNYFQGPEFRQNVASGSYYVKISNPENTGKFVLLLGTKEKFNLTEVYYSSARTSNHTLFRSDQAGPWGIITILLSLAAIDFVYILYRRKRRLYR